MLFNLAADTLKLTLKQWKLFIYVSFMRILFCSFDIFAVIKLEPSNNYRIFLTETHETPFSESIITRTKWDINQ